MARGFETYLKEKVLVQPRHLSSLMERVQTKKLEKNEFLLTEGQTCKHVFFVENGLLRFYTIDEAGKEHLVQFVPEEWFISDRSSIYFNEPSGFYVDSIEESMVAMLDRDFYNHALSLSPEFRNYNEFLLQNHIRQMQNRINLLLGASAETRYKEFLKLYPDIVSRVPQWMIASYLGITPESLSRVRKNLSR